MERKTLEERMQLFLEKNVPTSPSKWAYWKGQAKKKFDVYPSTTQTDGQLRCIKMQVVSGKPKRRSEETLGSFGQEQLIIV